MCKNTYLLYKYFDLLCIKFIIITKKLLLIIKYLYNNYVNIIVNYAKIISLLFILTIKLYKNTA